MDEPHILKTYVCFYFSNPTVATVPSRQVVPRGVGMAGIETNSVHKETCRIVHQTSQILHGRGNIASRTRSILKQNPRLPKSQLGQQEKRVSGSLNSSFRWFVRCPAGMHYHVRNTQDVGPI